MQDRDYGNSYRQETELQSLREITRLSQGVIKSVFFLLCTLSLIIIIKYDIEDYNATQRPADMNYPTSLTTGTDAQPTEDMFHKYFNAWCFG